MNIIINSINNQHNLIHGQLTIQDDFFNSQLLSS